MPVLKKTHNSLERYIVRRFSYLVLIILILLSLLFSYLELALPLQALCFVSIILVFWFFIRNFKRVILSIFDRLSLHVEAIQMEDYTQYAKPSFSDGKVGELHRELRALSESMFDKKSRYDQHVFLIYRLIDQLNTPILVFNQKQQLSYANGAFSQLYKQPWEMLRHASPKLLGLVQVEEYNQDGKLKEERNDGAKDVRWRLTEGNDQWQIRQSQFINEGETYLLLVFINISSALREGQLNAWQQIIRVLGHEIRNSLTPVSSLAENLFERADSERDKKALKHITERCDHLQDFVNRYSTISQDLQLDCQALSVNALVERMKGLFGDLISEVHINEGTLWADKIFIDQVLINIIKNAKEAEASEVKLYFDRDGEKSRIQVIDNGHGVANMDNLFVPLYTTKEEGQGIGLSFCRNIMEQHQGTIALKNNPEGVNVMLHLPRKKSSRT